MQKNPNATKISRHKKDAGQQMYPLLADIYGDVFDTSNQQ
jgi:hypothetical protein